MRSICNNIRPTAKTRKLRALKKVYHFFKVSFMKNYKYSINYHRLYFYDSNTNIVYLKDIRNN